MAALKTAPEILKTVIEDGRENLARANAGLALCVARSTEIFMSVFAGETPLLGYLLGFLAPATLGNTIGGVVLVTLLNFGQVVGSDKEHLPNADADL